MYIIIYHKLNRFQAIAKMKDLCALVKLRKKRNAITSC